MKKKFLSCIIIIAIILTILFLVKLIQINSFLNKVQENSKITNFEFEILNIDDNNNIWSRIKYLKKDSTLLIIHNENVKIYNIYNSDNSFLSIMIDEKNKQIYQTEYIQEEILTLSGNFKSHYSFIDKVKLCFNWKIRYEKLNDTDCIVIIDENQNTTYYNRENAYMLKSDNIGEIANIKINSVSENDIKMPDLEQYQLVQN